MENEVLIFIIAFLLPMLYYRTFFHVAKKIFTKSYLRKETGLKIHHLHVGMVLATISTFILILIGKNIYVIIFLGLGLGLMYDEFLPSLIMKSQRKDEVVVYKKTFLKTLILFIIIILIFLILSFLV